MPLEVEATYENGVLKPDVPLPLGEKERVKVQISTGISRSRQTAGLIQWTGDPAILREIAESPDFRQVETP